MKTIEQAAKDYADKKFPKIGLNDDWKDDGFDEGYDAAMHNKSIEEFKAGAEFMKNKYEEKLRWIPVDEKEPECELEDEGIFYSKYLEIKVKGYEHPFIGFYAKANGDQFFDFIHKTVDEGIKQDEITHFRFVL